MRTQGFPDNFPSGLVRAWWSRVPVAGLLLLHTGLLAWAASRHSPSVDEAGHLPAGISHWHFGRFDLYRVNPPLVRTLAALPVVLAGPATDWRHYFAGLRPEWPVGRDFLEANGARSFGYFTLARWACIPLSLLGGYVCFRWARDLYGRTAGHVALVLWCFCPNVLANAQMITPDTGASALGVTAAYLFWRWLRQPGWPQAMAAGAVLGLAELTKTTWIVLFLLWPLLGCAYLWPIRPRQAGQLAAILLLGLFIINLGYGFEGSFRQLGDFHFTSKALSDVEINDPEADRSTRGNRFAGTWLGGVPVPVPKNYLLGIDLQKYDFERQMPSYLGGQWKTGGWWYYYLYGLAVKVPLGTWALMLAALLVSLCARHYSAAARDEFVLLTPVAIVLVLVSSQTGFNHHLRYVLPVFPFAFIWTSKVAQAVDLRNWKFSAAAGAALVWSAGSSLGVYPHCMSYFNEPAGGPAGGHAHLVDSNIDWGQDLLHLKRWLDEHPEARPLGLAYSGFVDPRHAGIEFAPPPKGPVARERSPDSAADPAGPQPGWHAVSVNHLRGQGQEYAYFLRFRPVARAGYSIYIYHVSIEEANRVRRDLGLDEVNGSFSLRCPTR